MQSMHTDSEMITQQRARSHSKWPVITHTEHRSKGTTTSSTVGWPVLFTDCMFISYHNPLELDHMRENSKSIPVYGDEEHPHIQNSQGGNSWHSQYSRSFQRSQNIVVTKGRKKLPLSIETWSYTVNVHDVISRKASLITSMHQTFG